MNGRSVKEATRCSSPESFHPHPSTPTRSGAPLAAVRLQPDAAARRVPRPSACWPGSARTSSGAGCASAGPAEIVAGRVCGAESVGAYGVLLTRDADGDAARLRERLPAPRPRAAAVRRLARRPGRSSAPTTRGPTGSTERCAGRPALRDGRLDKSPLGLKRGPVREWHGWVFVDRSGRGAPSPSTSATSRTSSRRTTPRTLVTAETPRVRRGGQLEGDRRELPGVLPLLDDPPRAVPGQRRPRAARTSTPRATGSAAGWTCATAPQTMSLDGRSGGAVMARLDEHEKRTVMYVAVLPNLLISLHPDYVMTHLLTPLAPDLTRIRCSWAFPADGGRARGLRPGVRRGLLGPDQPAGLDGVRVGAARHARPGLRPRARCPRARTASTSSSAVAQAYQGS